VKIEISKRARRQAERISSWWEDNRPAAPTLFETEFEHALSLLLGAPRAGRPWPTTRRPGLRRLLLSKTQYHLYFTLEKNETVLVILVVWGAQRGRTPKL
jgi:plasmid stabilization system protein ParE